jgi:hypothetical protein
VLLPGVGSVTPTGGVIVAELASVPVAPAMIAAVNVYVAVPPLKRSAVVLMFPTPDPAAQADPVVATQVHVAPVSEAGSVSAIVAPVTADGPLFEATIVYVIAVPGTAVAELSVFVNARSAVTLSVSVSVAELLPGVESVTVTGAVIEAVFANVPVAPWAMFAVSVYVAVAPAAKLIVSPMKPVPDAAQVAPAEATHVHVAPLSDAGSVSRIVAPTTADGPAFAATIVYVTGVPGISVADPSVLVMDKSARGPSASVSVAMLLAFDGSVTPVGALTVALLVSEPVAAAEMVPLTV